VNGTTDDACNYFLCFNPLRHGEREREKDGGRVDAKRKSRVEVTLLPERGKRASFC
jgi:hypothetical protein